MSKKQHELEELNISLNQKSDQEDARAFAHLMRREVSLPAKSKENELDVDQIFQDVYDQIDSENNQVDT